MTRIVCEKKTIKKLRLTSASLNIKETNLAIVIETLCDRALELNRFIKNITKQSKNTSLRDLLAQLYSLEKKTTKKERVMLFIFKETINNRMLVLKLIKKHLSEMKPCTTQEALNIIRELEIQGFISLIRKCPKCNSEFNILPIKCAKCGHIFITQKTYYKDKRWRPRFAIEITKIGKNFVNELIKINFYINSFLQEFQRHKYSRNYQ